MTAEPTMFRGKTPTSPALTAQRSKRNRIHIAGGFMVFLLMLVYGVYNALQQYSRDSTNDNLLVVVIVGFCCLSWPFMMARFVVPKVEFFENHLVARSSWGFSRKRSYQEISTLEVKHDYLFFTFNDWGKISLSREEIKFEDLAAWLAERGVTAAQELEWASRERSEDRKQKQEAVEAVTLQNKTTLGPVLTVQAPRSNRITAFLFLGVPFILSLYALPVFVGRYLNNPKSLHLVAIPVLLLTSAIWFYCSTLVLLPKKVFFGTHILVRSRWGRSRRRSYQEIVHLAVVDDTLIVVFNDECWIEIPGSTIRPESFIRWLAERGVAAAREFKCPQK